MADLKYSKSHEWIGEEDGLSVSLDYAYIALVIVFINPPLRVTDEVTVGDALLITESVKAVSDVTLLQESLLKSTRAYSMHLRQSTRTHTALN